MAKASGIDKVIKSLEEDIAAHVREIQTKEMLISRLKAHLPAKKAVAKPKAVKKAEELKTA